MPRPAYGEGKYYERTERHYHEYSYSQKGIDYIQNKIKCVGFDDAYAILNFEKMCLDITFYEYEVRNANDPIFNNDPQHTINCIFCRTPTTPKLKHKQFGNHLDKCKHRRAFIAIENIMRLFNSFNRDIKQFDDAMKEYNFYEVDILDYCKSQHLYEDIENDATKSQWKHLIQSMVKSKLRWVDTMRNYEKLDIHLNVLKELKKDKQFINKYFDNLFSRICDEPVYEGFHNYVLDTIKKAINAYDNVIKNIFNIKDAMLIKLKKSYNEDILKLKYENAECGICIDEKLCRSTFCCRQKICADCSTSIKAGNATNYNCPFCRNNNEW